MARTGMLWLLGLAVGAGAGWWCGRVVRPEPDHAAVAQAVGAAQAAQQVVRAQQARLAVLERERAQAAADAAVWAGRCATAEAETALLRRTPPAPGSAEALPAAAPETLTGDPIRVVEVNAALKLLVVDAGRTRGMKAGLRFGVVHDGAAVADVRVVDVRETVAGVVLEKMYAGKTPVVGDRLIARRK